MYQRKSGGEIKAAAEFFSDDQDPEAVAYIMYTSGSTGKPKGVLVRHKQVNRIVYQNNFVKVTPDDRFAQISNFAFDGSVFDIFTPLCSGATLALMPKGDSFSVADVARFIIDQQLTCTFMTSTLFNAMVDSFPDALKEMNQIMIGGEKLSVAHINKALQFLDNTKLINGYGPTETTVFACHYPIEKKQYTGSIPIGFPVGGTRLMVLDDSGNLLPKGVPGELFIGGDGVSLGYLNRPDLSQERFATNPFDPSGGLIYRSGDLVRWNGAGELEYLGRMDEQVKVRGFRIELGELEYQLNQYPTVNATAVVARDVQHIKQLVAYYTGEKTDEQQLKSYLQDLLPAYMIPLTFVWLEELPLTLNGKINKRMLLSRKLEVNIGSGFKAPESKTELKLASIWQELLALEQVGVHDNFYELGGHSLLINQMLSRVNAEFEVSLTLKELFTSPTIAAISQQIEVTDEINYTPLVSQIRPDRIPLSYAQERLWFLNELGQGDQYHIPGFSLINGEFDMVTFKKAINQVVQRHENLRTCFRKVDDKPYQHIHDELIIHIERHECEGATTSDEKVKDIVDEFTRRPFDFENDPLIRVMLITLGDDNYLLGINLHHIISDGWSLTVFSAEMQEFYSAALNDREPDMSDLPIQYADYTIWQRENLNDLSLQSKLDHWVAHLTGYEDLVMPTDFKRPHALSGRGNTIADTFDREIIIKLRELAGRQESTIFSCLLTSVYSLLHLYSQQRDLCIGTPVANRNHQSLEQLIGFFVNTVVNRVIIEDDETFESLQNKVRDELFRSQSYQDVPFEKVVDAIKPERDLSRTPLFQVMVNYLNLGQPTEVLGEASYERVRMDYHSSKFDLNFTFTESAEGDIAFALEYSEDLFEESTVRQLMDHLKYLMRMFAESVDSRIHNISLDSVVRQNSLIDHGYRPVSQTIQARLEEVTLQVPDRIAVTDENQSITYRQLKQQSDQLALYLYQKGIVNDDLIAIRLDRSVDLIIAIVAVLKAGGAYFYIDNQLPEARQKAILEDSCASLLISKEQYAEALNKAYDGEILLIDNQVHQQHIAAATGVLVSPMDPAGLSYVIYTSGSTGRPKGVLQTHRTIVNLVNHQQDEYGHNIHTPKQVSQFASAGFDVSVQEVFFALLSGYTLAIVPARVKYDSGLMLKFAEEAKISIAFLPTAYLEIFCKEFAQNESIDLSGMERIVVAGEALKINEVTRNFFRLNPHIRLENQYGPSETHVVTAYTMDIDPESWADLPAIGKPISNTSVNLFNDALVEVPKGAIGELYFSGEGIARAYLKNLKLSAERFLTHPQTGQLMYKTGDLARWNSAGVLQFIGRTDEQVKIRGFRVETGEIETALSTYLGIYSVAVIAREISGSQQLLAFYQAESDTVELDAHQLDNHLKRLLPDFMIPAAYQKVDRIPLNQNGKVDRTALAMHQVSFDTDVVYRAPQNEVEEKLKLIWQELLEKDEIGVDDNFFTLGGHSLLATQVISRINRSFGRSIMLKELFEQPTIAQLAGIIEKGGQANEPDTAAATISPYERPELIPLSFAQERLWYINEMGQGQLYHMPDLSRVNGKFDKDNFYEAVKLLVQRHESLRTIMLEEGGQGYQLVMEQMDIPFVHHDIRYQSDKEGAKRDLISNFVNDYFNLKEGPLLRLMIIEEATDEFIIGLCMHHIISDGWSLKVLRKELNYFYDKLTKGEQPNLPELPVQYIDFTLWQRERYGSGGLVQALEHWQEHLTNYQDLILPTDFKRPARISGRGKHISIALGDTISRELKTYSKEKGVTLFSSLLTGVATVLHLHSRQEDFCIGMPVANRTEQSLESLIGFFVNTLINRIIINPHASVAELHDAVNRELIRSQNYQDIPFEKIVEALNPKRDMSRTPVFQVMASYVEPVKTENGEADISQKVDSAYDISKFDLNFVFSEIDGQIFTTLEYSTDLFREETVLGYLKNLEAVLSALTSDSTLTPGEIRLIDDQEFIRVTESFNAGTDYPEVEKSLHQLFTERAEGIADRVALYFGDQQMTYGDLGEQSTRMALYLQAIKIGEGDNVALCLDRSIEMIVTILAVLKSGAAYVPIDPQYPQERISYMLQDCGANTLITSEQYKKSAGEFSGPDLRILTVDGDKVLFDACEGILSNYGDSNSLAYIIYTSGSTGKPKGTLIRHGNVPRVCQFPNYLEIKEDDRILQLSNYAFDGSVFDIFGALLNGAGLVLIANETLLDVRALANYIEAQQVSVTFMTTALFNSLVDHSPDTLGGLRKVLFGGEMVSVQHVNKAFAETGPGRIVHVYGPTETTVFATYYPIEKECDDANLPIGKPLTGTGLYVFNESMKPVPVGMIGELYISGDGLASGYLNRPELTNERFISNPLNQGELLYKTGDLVKWGEQGNITFEGRADQQVKIRGFRIEIGEIENAISSHQQIDRCAIITREFKGSRQLIAFYVANAPVDVNDLKRSLAVSLPQYMIPSWFEVIEDIPLTANGKTDIRKLEAIDINMVSQREYEAPVSIAQKKLVAIWEEVLEVEKVGMNDNFFELGGHSLLATQILARINKEFGKEISLSSLLEEPTVRAMAGIIGDLNTTEVETRGFNGYKEDEEEIIL